MKHLKLFGSIIALILFLLTLVGFELHTLGTLGRVEPDNHILQQAVVQSSIFALAKLFVLLYIIYILILKAMEVYAVKQQGNKLDDLIDKLSKRFDKEAQEDKPNPKPVEDIDLRSFAPEVSFEQKLVKPLIENFEHFIDYKSAIIEYYRQVGGRKYNVASDVHNNLTYPINHEARYKQVSALIYRKFPDLSIDTVLDVLLDYCEASVREAIIESRDGN